MIKSTKPSTKPGAARAKLRLLHHLYDKHAFTTIDGLLYCAGCGVYMIERPWIAKERYAYAYGVIHHAAPPHGATAIQRADWLAQRQLMDNPLGCYESFVNQLVGLGKQRGGRGTKP